MNNQKLELFKVFLRISPLSFGGGYAMISIIEKEVSGKEWLSEEEFVRTITLAQSIPGAVAVNAAMLIGYRVSGILGAVLALCAIIAPTTLIVFLVLSFTNFFEHSEGFSHIIQGISLAVIALIFNAGLVTSKKSIIDKKTFLIFAVSMVILITFALNPIYLIVVAIIIGVLTEFIVQHSNCK